VTASHDHGHPHEHHEHHEHTHEHEHEHVTESQPRNLGLGAPVLDIGGDIGALVLYTTEDLEGLEIEVSPTADLDHRTHTQIHKRTVNGRTFWAGVYAQLKEGAYQVWWDDASRDRTFTITGGAVTELDWR
jgi:hypothetical protein